MADDMDDYQTQADADVLQKHQEITFDPERHQKALAYLKGIANKAKAAHKTGMQQFKNKVGKGMAKAFGKKGSSPFDRASGNQDTPFDEAKEGN